MCHLIFFIPIFALPVFWIFPFNTALKIYLIICGICFFIYFKIYQALRMKPLNGKQAMVGQTGHVIQDIAPEGKIQYATEIWNATAGGRKFFRGDKVMIHGFSWGLRAVVQETSDKKKIMGRYRILEGKP